MASIRELVANAAKAAGQALTKPEFDRKPGTGALFIHADNDTGEIARIEGVFVLPAPAGFTIRLDGTVTDGAGISLLGTVEGHPKAKVRGMLKPVVYDEAEDDDQTYKKGSITVTGYNGKEVTYKVNSKIKFAKDSGDPYRFMWFTHDQKRVAF